MSEPKSRHGQIKNALNHDSRVHNLTMNDIYNRFFRELFLGQLGALDDGWVLKGGTNLYFRLSQARHTRDLDLYRQDDPTSYEEAAQDLMKSMNGIQLGPYTFKITEPEDSRSHGTTKSVQLTVHVLQGVSKLSHFHIDVSGDLRAPTVTKKITVERSDSLKLTFAPREYSIRSYPIENQIADKVCAMYEMHGSRVSTRYRDLYDIALIALSLEVDGKELAAALQIQERLRHLTLPRQMHLPAPEWEKGYEGLKRTTPNLRDGITKISDALHVASLLVNPILNSAQESAGVWSPQRQAWS